MKMVFRWFGEGNDNISLDQIRQIPGVEGAVWSLHDISAGAEWPCSRILEVKKQCEESGLNIDVVESVNVHEDIKLGLSTRDKYIDNYRKTLKNLSKAGAKVICYNFMPVFDWIRTDLHKKLSDGSNAMFYDKSELENISSDELINRILESSGNFTIPGWEPERLSVIKNTFKAYEGFTEEKLWSNLEYFLKCIISVAEEYGIKMAIHPDDPPWSLFGLPRIVSNRNNIKKLLSLVDSEYNGLTLCSGSLGSNKENNIPELVREFGKRIHFAHIRNVRIYDNGNFIETSHRTKDGSLDIYEILKAYYEVGFDGYVRPDHGRHIWGEETRCRPGYGLYDRALGIMYILGIWDAITRNK
ncbi:MAG TPA: mannonate dehydratase [Victivallales bacterium]|nr:mannonate dehydratase [Victivallales bacterium]